MRLTDLFARIGDDSPVFEGNGWAARCPAHDDSEPSLRVAIGEGGKALLKCRAGCSTMDVLSAMRVNSFADLQPLENDMEEVRVVGDDTVPVAPDEQARMAEYLWNTAALLGDDALDYALRRFGLTAEQAQELGLGFDPGGASAVAYDRLGRVYHAVPRLVVPFPDFAGVPRGFQARAMADHKVRWSGPSNPETGAWSRYAFFRAGAGYDYVLVTEGPGDALAAVAAGFDALAIRGAAMAGKVADDIISNLPGRTIVLAGDADAAGRQFNAALATPLLDAGFTVLELSLPNGVNDLGEWAEALNGSFAADLQAAVGRAPAAGAMSHGERLVSMVAEARDALTDYGCAKELLSRFDGNVAHAPGLGFFLYEGGRWQRDAGSRIRVWAHEVADIVEEETEERYSELVEVLSQDQMDTLSTWRQLRQQFVVRVRTMRTLDQALTELEAHTFVPVDRFDKQPHLLACRNGTVNLRDATLREHRREDYITHMLDIDYDADATCPRWEQFIREVQPNATEQMAAWLQRLVGYGITGHTDEQAFAVLWGRGANGKSVFTDTLTEVFRAVTVTTPFSTFEKKPSGGIPNDLAALRGARLVFASEGESGNAMAESVIKRVTGQDLISARFMRAEFFEFRPTFLIMLATNHKPSFRGQDEGLWRRVKLVPFSRYFAPEDRDHHLTRKLRDEAQGILRWAVEGARLWFAEGGLLDPHIVASATNDYREVSDALAGFFPGALVEAEGEQVLGKRAYEMYRDWCYDEGIAEKNIWSNRGFFSAMEERGVFRRKTNEGIALLGVRESAGNDSEDQTGVGIFGTANR
jgi:putative DNA primase/helicase